MPLRGRIRRTFYARAFFVCIRSSGEDSKAGTAAPAGASAMGRLAKSARRSWKLVQETSREFWEDNVLALGAGLAYYSVFSIVPILVIVIAIAGIAFGEEAVRTGIYGQARGLVGSEGAGQIRTMMNAHPHRAAVWKKRRDTGGPARSIQGCFSRAFCSPGRTTDPNSVSFNAPRTARGGWARSPARPASSFPCARRRGTARGRTRPPRAATACLR